MTQAEINKFINEEQDYIRRISRKMWSRNPFIEYEDFVQEANIILLEELSSFNPDFGASKKTFSYDMIKKRMIDRYRKNSLNKSFEVDETYASKEDLYYESKLEEQIDQKRSAEKVKSNFPHMYRRIQGETIIDMSESDGVNRSTSHRRLETEKKKFGIETQPK